MTYYVTFYTKRQGNFEYTEVFKVINCPDDIVPSDGTDVNNQFAIAVATNAGYLEDFQLPDSEEGLVFAITDSTTEEVAGEINFVELHI
ncbi:hypothetical protein HF324_18385 [Chitinophaga oryzae]|uniref:Uncharacterized protein n=1 Tax=Chitinophaga oryzae TaxID=2725414 RepID=A0ABX6LI36_9BACT|nr:hypothetical protein [Chitinophaga oryzae]QJB39717.1 hypothetical protein HF324_18385 [Chitinophaga oryzae]